MITGMRRGEISALRWRHVDFATATLLVQRAKRQRVELELRGSERELRGSQAKLRVRKRARATGPDAELTSQEP